MGFREEGRRVTRQKVDTGIIPAETPTVVDAAVVLGAEVFGPGRPSAAVQRRVEHGVMVWRRLRIPFLVVSGGVGKAGISEASVMRDLAVDLGVPPDAIVLEDGSHSTLEQAVAVTRLARAGGWEALVVVSDRFHVPRARFLFRRMGLSVAGAPVTGPGPGSRRKWLGAWVREAAAWVKALGQWAGGILRRAARGAANPDP